MTIAEQIAEKEAARDRLNEEIIDYQCHGVDFASGIRCTGYEPIKREVGNDGMDD